MRNGTNSLGETMGFRFSQSRKLNERQNMTAIIRTVGRRLTGEDSTVPSGMAAGQDVYVGYSSGAPGYRNGSFNDYEAVKNAFPGKKYISVGLDCIDVEPGLALPGDVPGFIHNWKPVNTNKPIIYSDRSDTIAVNAELNRAGIPRSAYYYWLAAPNGSAPIPAGYDGLQWAFGQGEDSDYFYDYLWDAPAPPPPPPDPNHLDVDGFEIRKPSNGLVPCVIGWWGTSGLTRRAAVMSQQTWDDITWLSK